MPRVELTMPAGAVPGEAREELPRQLAEAMLRWEGAPDTEFFRSISWVHVHELPADALYTADGRAELSQFVIDVSVPEGGLSERRRAGLVEEFTKLVKQAAGLGDEDATRVWVLVHEVPDGFWGAAGQIIRFEQLREAAKAQREQAGTPA